MNHYEEILKEARKLLGRQGGNATKTKYGREYYAEIGRKGGIANAKKKKEAKEQKA